MNPHDGMYLFQRKTLFGLTPLIALIDFVIFNVEPAVTHNCVPLLESVLQFFDLPQMSTYLNSLTIPLCFRSEFTSNQCECY